MDFSRERLAALARMHSWLIFLRMETVYQIFPAPTAQQSKPWRKVSAATVSFLKRAELDDVNLSGQIRRHFESNFLFPNFGLGPVLHDVLQNEVGPHYKSYI
jgi:hypothetical protein